MQLKTIYFNNFKELKRNNYLDLLKEYIENLPTDKGIIIVDGYLSTESIKIPQPLCTFICRDISFLSNAVIEKLSEKYIITSLSYKECEDDLKNSIFYLTLVKNLNPILIYNREINNHLEKLQLKNFDNYNNAKFENLNKKVFFNKSYISKTELEKIPNTTGIYFIYNENKELMYIGKTIHLNSRITDHLTGRTNTNDICHNFNYIKYIEIDNNDLLGLYETYFINSYKPKLNVSKVQTYHSERYDPKYNKNLNDFFDLKHMLRYRFAKEYLEKKFNIRKLIAEREKEILKDIAVMKDLFL